MVAPYIGVVKGSSHQITENALSRKEVMLMRAIDFIGPWLVAAVLLFLFCIASELTDGFSSPIFP